VTAALEEAKIIDIEEWLTLATAPSPTKLKQGQTPNAKNVWVDEKPGSVVTAPGYLKVGTTPSNNPSPFCINYFKTSSGTQTFVISDNATVWTTVDFQNFTAIITGLASAFQLRGLVVRDKLWLTNGSDAVRTFDGTTVVVLDGTGGTPIVPKGRYISYHDERVWLGHIPSNRSQVAFSALTDASANIIPPDNVSAWPASNTLQVSEGDADFLTGMMLYRGYLHFFKQYSIWRLVGFDEYTYTRVKTRASTGSRFNESLQVLDSLIHLIGIDGLYVFDGEETARISDIIDPETATQTAFGFNQLQQPNVNNLFWEVTATADWNAGTVPTDLVIANSAALIAADDTQADFAAGTTQTNVDTSTNPGFLQLALVTSGSSGGNVSLGKSASLTTDNDPNVPRFGTASQITDGNFSNNVGFSVRTGATSCFWNIDLGAPFLIGQAIIKGIYAEGVQGGITILTQPTIQYSTDNVNWSTAVTLSLPGAVTHSDHAGILYSQPNTGWQSIGPTDLTGNFNSVTARYWRLFVGVSIGAGVVITELQIFQAGFQPTGLFVSKTLDYGAVPNSYGNFNASEVLNGGTTSYFTQSSSDGISFGGAVNVANGAAIGSTLNRYLRWGVHFTSGNSGATSPVIDNAFLGAQYLSAIHDTGGSIFAWGPFEADRTLPLQCNFYYRTATTSGGIPAAVWNLIVPGGVISAPVANRFIQFKIEILNGDATHLPVVNSVTINWIKGTGVQSQVLQNVASYVWRNRYWMAAAGPGATANDTVLIRGKKTFGSPWQLKDFPLLSFTRYQDSLYAGSSLDGSIYQIDTGFSKNGLAIDSYFQTGDFTFGGFYINPIELLVEVERKGPYNLTVGFSIDRGNTWDDEIVDLTPSTFAPSYTKKINTDTVNTDRIRFRVRINGVDKPFEVHRLIFYYKMDASRGSIK
jgi:hypothetical protein